MVEFPELALAEIRKALRLVGSCRRVGSDVYAWNQCLNEGIREHIPSTFVTAFAFELSQTQFTLDHAKLFYDYWADDRHRQTWLDFYEAGEMDHLLSTERLFQNFAGARVARRVDLISDEEWATCREFTRLRSACNQDDFIFSVFAVANSNVLFCVTLNRDIGQTPYSEADRQWMQLLLEELTSFLGSELSLDDNCPYRTLPPRLLQVFELLMQGETEKAIATTLNLSPHTVHEYVMDLYRRFRVNRRGALITAAYAMGWKAKNT